MFVSLSQKLLDSRLEADRLATVARASSQPTPSQNSYAASAPAKAAVVLDEPEEPTSASSSCC